MIFNSFQFLFFFIFILCSYWSLKHKNQNILLLIGSYYFYGVWDWRFLFLMFFSTVVDYFIGGAIYRKKQTSESAAKKLVALSVISNLSILGFFKYFNFFTQSMFDLLSVVGLNPNIHVLNIILPVGISFYTFQTISYSIDIYRGEIKPAKNLLNFALFVSFFPQLVAGPIERAKTFLPQVEMPRVFNSDQFKRGLYLIFWGLFKKVYVADNLGPVVDNLFSQGTDSGMVVMLGCWLFAFQIYADFSGYSDTARGCAKCLGMELMINFKFPYISKSPSEFWRRWHISLSQWLRDYLYIPLGGNRGSNWKTRRNLFLTMLLGGIWHGAAWNFIIWGAYQGGLLIVYKELSDRIKAKILPGLLSWFIMFQLVCFGWLIFRAESFAQIQDMTTTLFAGSWVIDEQSYLLLMTLGKFVLPLVLFEVYQIKVIEWLRIRWPQSVASTFNAMFLAICFYLFAFYGASADSFIYFQF